MINKSPWQRLSELLRLDKPLVTRLYLYALFSGIVALSLPLGIQSVIHFIQAGQITTSWIILILLVIGGVVLSGVLQIMQLRITETIQQRIFVRYSFDFAYRFPRISRSMLDDKIPAELMNRFFDIISLQKGIAKVLLDLSSALLLITFSLLVLSFYHPFYIIFSLLMVALVLSVFRPIMKRGIQTSLDESKHKYKTAYWLQEIARADWTFRLSPGSGTHSLDRLDRHAQDYLASRESHFKVLWSQYIWMIALKSIGVAALLGLGGYLVIDQQMNLGQFVAAEILILLILGAVEKIIQLLETVYDVFTSLEKLGQIQDVPIAYEQGKGSFSVNEFFPIELIDIRTEYVNSILQVNKGEHILLQIANQQEGVTVLRSLIDPSVSDKFQPRWNHAEPQREYIPDAYEHIGWFTPDTYVFEGTVRENVLLGREAISSDQLHKALKTTGIDELLSAKPKGYETAIRDGSDVLSSNDMERLLFGRSIVHSPALLLVSFFGSSLGHHEQQSLLVSVMKAYPQTTIVCISPNDYNIDSLKKTIIDLKNN